MNYRILSLEASNIKKLKAVRITPERNVITLTGDNGSGKSSVLDSIVYALGGKDGICEQPLRWGSSSGEVVCKLNSLVVRRKFGSSGTTLTIMDESGKAQSSPQALLDSLVGKIAFDPMAFSRLKPREQAEMLRELVGLDFSKQEEERERLYSQRTVLNREVERFRARLAEMQHDPNAKEPVDGLIRELAEAEQKNEQHRKAGADAKAARTAQRYAQEHVARCEEEFERTKKLFEMAQGALERARKEDLVSRQNCQDAEKAASACAVVDTQAIRDRLTKAQANHAYERMREEMSASAKSADQLSRQLQDLDRSKSEMLSKASFPLEGLSFDDAGVLFNGLPFSQASDGEKLRVSVAIGMALNPKLRIMFVRDGSLLDANGLRTIAEMAEKHDFQVWLEDARSTDPAAILIEDGQVKDFPHGGNSRQVSTPVAAE